MLGHNGISGAPIAAVRRALFTPGRIAAGIIGTPLVPKALTGAVHYPAGLVGVVPQPAGLTGAA